MRIDDKMEIGPGGTSPFGNSRMPSGTIALEKGNDGQPVSQSRDASAVLVAYADGHGVTGKGPASTDEHGALNLKRIGQQLGKPAVRKELLNGYHLPRNYTSWYYDRRIYPYLAKPDFEGPAKPDVLYRGMYITIDELTNIINEGFELSRTSWHTGGKKGVSFSSSATEARNYIFTEPRDINGIGIVFEVSAGKGIGPMEKSEVNPTGTIYRSDGDVPADRIVDILVWGRWGCERLSKIIEKIREGTVTPHREWTDVSSPFGDR